VANPSKPTNVNVQKLNDVLGNLLNLQDELAHPTSGSWGAVGQTIATDLKQGDNGMQENVATVAGQRYADNVTFITEAWGDIKTGVDTLVSMLQTTIAKHGGTDAGVAKTANATGTGTGGNATGSTTAPRGAN
jgi:hypothetical protein